ncbi:GtrA family protein [Commensalibacter oyaizuii]|uniref:GtrA family protein n=1 Tax=Commensalibacter oyaizuii TaxID=3043873 RepID=A0ABT6PYF8_9PROT|nr:GtrA family protein [Commensalibacter sp. TBRC 16381]MDI2089897.1 GtrA family protein [Commensalibacter sp. TBRC 16381]
MWVLLSKYVIVGLANTLLTMIIIFVLMHLGVGLYISNASGYVAGIILSFVLNSLFTFSTKLSVSKLVKFLVACLIAYGVNLVAIKVCLFWQPTYLYLAQLCGMGFYTITGFILNKLWVMK